MNQRVCIAMLARERYQREPYAVCDQADASQDLAFIKNQRKDYAASLYEPSA